MRISRVENWRCGEPILFGCGLDIKRRSLWKRCRSKALSVEIALGYCKALNRSDETQATDRNTTGPSRLIANSLKNAGR